MFCLNLNLKTDGLMQGIALMLSPSLWLFKVFNLDTHIPRPALRPLPSAWIAYAARAASLPPTATNYVTLLSHWRSSASVVSCTQRYSAWQL